VALTNAEREEIDRRHRLRAQGIDVSFLRRRNVRPSIGAMLFQSAISMEAATECWRKLSLAERKRLWPHFEHMLQCVDEAQAAIEEWLGCKLADLFPPKDRLKRRQL
jgi:hypothetical protein